MITKLSRDQNLNLVLSKHLGNAIDDKVDHPSGVRMFGLDGSRFEVLTSLEEVFLNMPLFVDEIDYDFQNEYSKVAKGENFTYTLA